MTQLGMASFTTFPMRRHYKPRYPQLNVCCLHEPVACDTFFANTCDRTGATCAQVFYGVKSKMINVYGMRSENEAPTAYKDFIRSEGAPSVLHRDNSKVQKDEAFTELNCHYAIRDKFTKPYHPQQNPAEMRAIKWIKQHSQVLMDRHQVPEWLWFACCEHLCDIHNFTAHEELDWLTPYAKHHGETPDISAYL